MNLPDLNQLQQRVADLERQLTDPATMRNQSLIKEVYSAHAHAQSLHEVVARLAAITAERAELQTLLAGGDTELAQMAADDAARLDAEEAALRRRLEELLVPPDPHDSRDVILEIRAGAGGEEAALFAAELFRAYTRYAELAGWKVHTLSSSLGEQGGYKEIIAEVTGKNVFGTLKFERGVHRVQRVPATEKMGRIHTSTVTVAVLPQAEEVDFEIKKEDLRIDTYRSGGAGGQHVNKTSSAIRITHLPTNTVVAVQDERSQHKNKEKAMSILRSRLLEAREAAAAQQAASDRKAQVGTGDRSEKIRTYNFPQDRITDHRIKESWGNIPAVMNGEWEPIFTALHHADRELKLSQAQ